MDGWTEVTTQPGKSYSISQICTEPVFSLSL